MYYLLMVIWLAIYLIGGSRLISSNNSTIPYESTVLYSGTVKKRRRNIVLMAVALFVVMALRADSVGTDYASYAAEYKIYLNYPLSSIKFLYNSEFGYKIILILANKIGLSWRAFSIVLSAAEVIVISKFINKHCINEFFGFFLYLTIGVFAMNLSGVRQSIAMIILIVATEYGMKKKYLPYILLVIAATSIHYSALFFLPTIIIFHLHYKRKIQLVVFLALPIIVRVLSSTIEVLMRRFATEKYIDYGYFSSMNYTISFAVELTAALILIAIFGTFIIKDNVKINNNDFHFFILTSIYVCCIELSHSAYMALRLSFYFSLFMTVTLSNAVSNLENVRTKLIGYCCLVTLPLAQFIITIPDSSLKIVPYLFFWN